MRNPWGKDGEYNGTWSDKDVIWNDTTQTFKKQLPFARNEKDGIFYIDYKDFNKTF